MTRRATSALARSLGSVRRIRKPQMPQDDREADGPEEVDGELLEPGGRGAALVQPADAALDHAPAAAVGLAVELVLVARHAFRLLAGDHQLDPPLGQPRADPLAGVR